MQNLLPLPKLGSSVENQKAMLEGLALLIYTCATYLYVSTIPSIPGAHSQGATLDELQTNLKEVLELCLEELAISFDELPRFVGLQQVEVAA